MNTKIQDAGSANSIAARLHNSATASTDWNWLEDGHYTSDVSLGFAELARVARRGACARTHTEDRRVRLGIACGLLTLNSVR